MRRAGEKKSDYVHVNIPLRKRATADGLLEATDNCKVKCVRRTDTFHSD